MESSIPGVTAKELYLRQNGLCTLYSSSEKGEHIEADNVYCVYDKEFARTGLLLNPTQECIGCILNKMTNTINEYVDNLNIDKVFVSLIIAISSSEEKIVYMSRETFEWIEKYIDNNTLYSEVTKPIRVSSAGDIYLFGAVVNFNNTEQGHIMVGEKDYLLYE